MPMYPILLKVPFVDLPVYAYGVMLGLGFISGWYLAMHFANREGIPYKATTWIFVLAIVFALVGARVAHIISNSTWDQVQLYGLFPTIFASKCEGLVAYGGYLGGTLAAWVFCRVRQIDFWALCDVCSASLVLGLGMTRIGCFLAGCCHGKETDLPWAISFPVGSQASRVFTGGIAASPPVHPTQIYESLLGFLLLPLAIVLIRKRKFTGQAFLIMICCYAVGRFLLEFIRADDDRGTVFGVLSTSQFIGLVLVPVAIGLYIWRLKTAAKPNTPLTKEQVTESLIEQGVIVVSEKKGKSAQKDNETSQKDSEKAKTPKEPSKGGGSKKKGKKKKGKKKK
jgi:phosphatidylglycerol:prolipoprotein diacylglycerol transferase